MGFLYPWSRIRDGRIPAREHLTMFAGELVEAMREHEGVHAASVYGSVARGDHTLRSDLDFVAICDRRVLREVQTKIDLLGDRAFNHNVVVSPYLLSTDECAAGRTRFGPSFQETFRRLSRESSMTFGEPHMLLAAPSQDIASEMRTKLVLNMRRLLREHAYFKQLPDLCHPLAFDSWAEEAMQRNHRLFHVYMGFARWILWWKRGSLEDDTKLGVVEAFMTEPAFTPLWHDFLELHDVDRDYDDLLERSLSGKVRRQVYIFRTVVLVRRAFQLCTRLFSRAAALMGIRQTQAFARFSKQAERIAA